MTKRGFGTGVRQTINVNEPSTLVAGWKEWVGLPDLGVEWIKAKMDTGARSSALHAYALECFERDGHEWVRFEVHPWQMSELDAVPIELPLVEQRTVRSSTGHAEDRFVVATTLRVGTLGFMTELTLTNRDTMGLRMLVGRQAMRHRILIDSARMYLTGRPPRSVRARNRERAR